MRSTLTRFQRRLPGARGDAGSMTLFYIGAALCLLVVIGLVADGGGALNAASRADAIAAEAARAGGQQLDASQAIPGTAIVVDPEAARAAASAYLTQAGVTGTVDVSADRTTLTVTVHDHYTTAFASLIGYSQIQVTGHGTAHLLHQAGG